MNHKSMAVLVCPMGSEDIDSWDFAASWWHEISVFSGRLDDSFLPGITAETTVKSSTDLNTTSQER